MKIHIYILTLLILICPLNAYAQTGDNIQYDNTKEAIEWSVTLGLGGLAGYIETTPVWNEVSVIGGESNKEYKHETVPTLYLLGGIPVIMSGIAFLPNNQGWMNDTAYINAKGFTQAMVANILTTLIVKRTITRKRPDYDARISANIDTDDAMMSFFSGHSSVSFSMATYASLYTMQHIGDLNNPYHIAGKSAFAALTFGLASWVAWTRLNDNKHHIEDVLVGATVGTAISALVYMIQNEWFFKIYNRDNNIANIGTRGLTSNLVQYKFVF